MGYIMIFNRLPGIPNVALLVPPMVYMMNFHLLQRRKYLYGAALTFKLPSTRTYVISCHHCFKNLMIFDYLIWWFLIWWFFSSDYKNLMIFDFWLLLANNFLGLIKLSTCLLRADCFSIITRASYMDSFMGTGIISNIFTLDFTSSLLFY